jgi:hypothetical protein
MGRERLDFRYVFYDVYEGFEHMVLMEYGIHST